MTGEISWPVPRPSGSARAGTHGPGTRQATANRRVLRRGPRQSSARLDGRKPGTRDGRRPEPGGVHHVGSTSAQSHPGPSPVCCAPAQVAGEPQHARVVGPGPFVGGCEHLYRVARAMSSSRRSAVWGRRTTDVRWKDSRDDQHSHSRAPGVWPEARQGVRLAHDDRAPGPR